MIYVNIPTQQDLIIKLLEENTEATFKFQEKQGLKLMFQVEGIDEESAVAIAKACLKADPVAANLYFQVGK